MKESIKIRNLGPLRDIEIRDIRHMTILIGESGCGKSLLMKTLILFRYIYKMLNIRWYLRNSNVNKSRFKLSIVNFLSPELKQYFRNNKQLEIEYSVEINGNRHCVSYRNGSIDRTTTDRHIPDEDLIFLKESWISEMRNVIPEWSTIGHIPKKKDLNFYFQETLSDFLDASDEIKTVNLDYLGLSLNVEKKGNSRKYYIRPLDESYLPMEWKYASSGVQTSTSIPVLVDYFSSVFSFKDAIQRSIINYLYQTDTLRQYNPKLEPMDMRKYVHIHIEEPELNLFPSAQCGLIDDIVRKSFNINHDDRHIRLIMATHSPYIVNYLNVLIHQKDEEKGKLNVSDLAVYRLYDGRLQSLIAEDERGRKFVDTYDLTEQMESIMFGESFDFIQVKYPHEFNWQS